MTAYIRTVYKTKQDKELDTIIGTEKYFRLAEMERKLNGVDIPQEPIELESYKHTPKTVTFREVCSIVMKNAWNTKREFKWMSFSSCLCAAWKQVRGLYVWKQ